ncbi:MAG: ABC transporter permease [Acidimicrobiia bacterium]|nr:ABC transporter permease [Acidimicrobiia bacterium]
MTTIAPHRERSLFARVFTGPAAGITIRRSLFFFMLFLAVIGPWIESIGQWIPIPFYDPLRRDPFIPVSPPSAEHWFGTDTLGLDIFTRVIVATRVDFTLALIGVTLGGGLGCLAGAWAAYRRGWVDTVALRFVEVVQSFPVLLLGLALFAALGPLDIFGPVDHGMAVLVIAIAMVNFPLYLRQVRSVLLPLTEAEFVQAAKCAGLGAWGIVWNHFLPNARGQILALFALTCAYAIQIIAGLSFIGLGIEPPNPEWGSMIKTGATLIVQGHWWVSVFPGAAIVLSVYSLTGFSVRSETVIGPGGTST